METYKEILEKVAEKEWYTMIFYLVILFLITVIVWISVYIYNIKVKKIHTKKFKLEKQIRIRRNNIFASLLLTIICIGLGLGFYFDAADTVKDIKKDIEDESYVTYVGGYYIDSNSYRLKYTWYNKWWSVDFENSNYAFIYINSLAEWTSMKEGQNEGQVVYGKNSLIVVDLEN